MSKQAPDLGGMLSKDTPAKPAAQRGSLPEKRAGGKIPRHRLSLALELDMFEDLRDFAHRNYMTHQDVMEEAIQEFLTKKKP